MKITDIDNTLVRSFDITGGPVLSRPYSSQILRIDYIKIEYRLSASGEWGVPSSYGVRLAGHVVKKDGTNGVTRGDMSADYDYETKTEWEWLLDIVEKARPTPVDYSASSFAPMYVYPILKEEQVKA